MKQDFLLKGENSGNLLEKKVQMKTQLPPQKQKLPVTGQEDISSVQSSQQSPEDDCQKNTIHKKGKFDRLWIRSYRASYLAFYLQRFYLTPFCQEYRCWEKTRKIYRELSQTLKGKSITNVMRYERNLKLRFAANCPDFDQFIMEEAQKIRDDFKAVDQLLKKLQKQTNDVKCHMNLIKRKMNVLQQLQKSLTDFFGPL